MAFRSVTIPWLGGGLVVLGYAAFNWLRSKRTQRARAELPSLGQQSLEPLAATLERIPEELALDLEAEPPSANSTAVSSSAELGALFLGRASTALSPVQFGPDRPSVER